MSYRCGACRQVCHHKMIRHVVEREIKQAVLETVVSMRDRLVTRVKTTRDGRPVLKAIRQVAKEVPVCRHCKIELDMGIPLASIRERFRVEDVVQSSEDSGGAGAALSPEEKAPGDGHGAPAQRMATNPAQRDTPARKRLGEMFDDRR